MPQNQSTGAEANAFGRVSAAKIAQAIGATLTRKGSNEATLAGKRVVIKSASRNTSSVGVSLKMLPTLDEVIGAFEQDDGAFVLFTLDADIYGKHQIPTRSQGRSAGRVGMVSKQVFVKKGKRMQRLTR